MAITWTKSAYKDISAFLFLTLLCTNSAFAQIGSISSQSQQIQGTEKIPGCSQITIKSAALNIASIDIRSGALLTDILKFNPIVTISNFTVAKQEDDVSRFTNEYAKAYIQLTTLQPIQVILQRPTTQPGTNELAVEYFSATKTPIAFLHDTAATVCPIRPPVLSEGLTIRCITADPMISSTLFRYTNGTRREYSSTALEQSWGVSSNDAALVDCAKIPAGPEMGLNPRFVKDGQTLRCAGDPSSPGYVLFRFEQGVRRVYPSVSVINSWDRDYMKAELFDCTNFPRGPDMQIRTLSM